MEAGHSGSVVVTETIKPSRSHAKVFRHEVSFRMPGEKDGSVTTIERTGLPKHLQTNDTNQKGMVHEIETNKAMDTPKDVDKNGINPTKAESDKIAHKTKMQQNGAIAKERDTGNKNSNNMAQKSDRISRKNSMDKSAGTLQLPVSSGARKRSTSSASSEPSRGERLRKSLLAKSMSSLAPLYIDQILPPEPALLYHINYERTKGPGYLYVISESSDTGFRGNVFKIGVTSDIKLRLRDLQNGNPRPLIPELLLKVHDMEKVEDFVVDVLREYTFNINGGKGWYKTETTENGRNAVMDLIEDVKGMHYGVEIPPEKFSDYMHYYINFDC